MKKFDDEDGWNLIKMKSVILENLNFKIQEKKFYYGDVKKC